MLTALTILIILTVSVLVHELAHYLNARSVGLPVRAFSVGMGPIIWRKQWRGTEWRISLIPLGGYVDLPGLAAEPNEQGELQYPAGGFAAKNLAQKLWILVGGVIANSILAVLLLALTITLNPNYRSLTANIPVSETGTVFADVIEGSAAEALGIEAGDIVLQMNGVDNPGRNELSQLVRESSRLELKLERNGAVINIATPWPLAPQATTDRPMLGVTLAPLEFESPPAISYGQALVESTTFFVRIVPESVRGFVRGFGQTFAGQRSEEIVGPVGIVGLFNQATKAGIVPVIFLAAIINFSLAIFNLLPIPSLDGGRMLLATIVAIRGRPFKPGQEEFIHFLGFVTIMAFIILMTFSEIGDLFRG